MGTRADFYVGRGLAAEWLGSKGYDGYPEGIADTLLQATDEAQYRNEVTRFLDGKRDATKPNDGWPWPWDNSSLTDYTYAFDDGKVLASCFGSEWVDPLVAEIDYDALEDKVAVFPDMSARKNVVFGARGGNIVIASDEKGVTRVID